MSLYLQYRPDSLEAIRGNTTTVSKLQGLLKNRDKFPHTILLQGMTGCGKTTIGRIIANELGCKGNDYREINSGDFRGIDTVRDISKACEYKPLEGPCRVYLIDECHKMTNDAQNAFLKRLEDTPKHIYFILCTTDPGKLIAAVKNRCSTFQVDPLTDVQMKGLLKGVARKEGESLNDEILSQIVQDSLGQPRKALVILEQVLSVSEEERLEVAKQTAIQETQVIELCRVLLKKGASWKEVSSILVSIQEQDPEDIRRMVLGYCKSVLLKSDNPTAGLIMDFFIEPFYNSGFPGLIHACYSVVKN